MKLLPCPFCGRVNDPTDEDTMHPTGTTWTNEELAGDYFRRYHHYTEVWPGDGRVMVLNCPTIYGGCGVEMTADTEEELIEKWNRRYEAPVSGS